MHVNERRTVARGAQTRRTARTGGLVADPRWYKDAVIYEVRTRSYYDANGDGIGDLQGLMERLPYLQDLGVTALWLLPLMPSPGRDDGYDISDYFDVHPDVGTLADFDRFIAEAHRRGIRVITELVMNHTSDMHPWFQRARRAPPGSPERDFYVWSDEPDKYKEARIIFQDFEPSNWTFDRVAGQYYWHRFFSHQPDLNFENAAVREAMFSVCDFWFARGVDGLRLDAVPYLFEEEGTNCENLPKTHAFLKELRAHVDTKFADRMLLAEANQWPEDAAAYFGDGDECHMNFHFPLMPRMFMGVRMEDRFPLMDILAQTPPLKGDSQWALFLRNHDELTLEMVTDEERDFMYRAYAADTEMRINLGIRRRLAPLVGNNRRKIELLNALLFSLPGTPVLYYGDEIGMGDNVYLGDRNGVRTPMQWTGDRNAGFSKANPQKLILPVMMTSEYHYETINVEAQQENPSSLLWWMKRLIALRSGFKAFGRGSIEFLHPVNPRIVAFTREYEDEKILVVLNLSRFPQYVELDLAKYEGLSPVELFGRTAFPTIGKNPYIVTVGPHAFFWFSLESTRVTEGGSRVVAYEPPSIELAKPEGVFAGSAVLDDVLPSFLESRRGYLRNQRALNGLRVVDILPFPEAGANLHLVIARVEYSDADAQNVLVPLSIATNRPTGGAVLAVLRSGDSESFLVEATEVPDGAQALLRIVSQGMQVTGGTGEAIGVSLVTLPEIDGADPRLVNAEHANAAIQYGDKALLKLFRRLDDGFSPEVELTRHVAESAPSLVAPPLGTIDLRRPRREAVTLGVLETFIPNQGTGWRYSRNELGRFFETILTSARDEAPPPLPTAPLLTLAQESPPEAVRNRMGAYLDSARLLGRRTAELHRALSNGGSAEFEPEPYSSFDRRSLYQSLRNLGGVVVRTLRAHLGSLPPEAQALARAVVDYEAHIFQRFEPLLTVRLTALRMRNHGDLHLEQVLYTGNDFVFIDFDGGGDKELSERRRKRSALRDVAGMLRSFDWSAMVTLLDERTVRPADRALVMPWAEQWNAWSAAAYLGSYLATAAGAAYMPATQEELALLLDTFVFRKTLRQLEGELRARPGSNGGEFITVPLRALVRTFGLEVPSSVLGEK
jgi:maltose alpha-D-glucosyltransferase/alpha-amylase